jgi:hypothetical protein
MKRKLSFKFLLPALLFIMFTACTKDARDEAKQESLVSASVNQSSRGSGGSVNAVEKMLKPDILKAVKQATSRFHSTTQAIKAGYLRDEHCVSSPAGGMGYHWANPSLIDPILNPLEPEALLYAKGPDGNLRLVGLEYIVINTGQLRPTFGDQPMDIMGVPPLTQQRIPHWSLHVW